MSNKTKQPNNDVEIIDKENEKPGSKIILKKGQKNKQEKVSVIHVADDEPELAPGKKRESVIPEEEMEVEENTEDHEEEMRQSEDDDDNDCVIESIADDETVKASEPKVAAETEFAKDIEATIKQLQDSIGGLPESLFGVKLEEAGSASMAHQIVMHSKLIKLHEQIKAMVSDDRTAADQVKSIHDMLQTIHDSQKKGLESWKKTTVAEAKKWRQEWKKESIEKESAQDKEIARLRSMVQELLNAQLTSAVQKQEEGSEKVAPKLKRTSEEAFPSKPEAKWVRKESPISSSSTPEERYRAAFAKRKKANFSCTLCVSNDHKSVVCGTYGTIQARQRRMEELGICMICGRGHSDACHFTSSKPCELCGASHLTQLCVKTFEQ